MLDTPCGLYDRMLITDEELLGRLSCKRGQREEEHADRKAVELLRFRPERKNV